MISIRNNCRFNSQLARSQEISYIAIEDVKSDYGDFSNSSNGLLSFDGARKSSQKSLFRFRETTRNRSAELKLKMKNSTSQGSVATTTTCSSSTVESSLSPLSEMCFSLSGKPISAAVNFANQCLVRSYERRSRSIVIILPPSFSLKSHPSSCDINSSLESSSISSPLAACNVSSVVPSSAAPSELSLVVSEPITSTSLKASETSQSLEKLLNDVRQLPSREQEIKTKLRLIKIKHYRQRCMHSVQSLNESMVHYNKLNDINDSNDDSEGFSIHIRSPAPGETENGGIASKEEFVKDIPKKPTSINLVFSKISILFDLYKDALSNVIDLDACLRN